MKNLIKILAVLIFASTLSIAQWKALPEGETNRNLSGILTLDYYSTQSLKSIKDSIKTDYNSEMPGKKSPILAGAMSLIVPGAGEAYTKNYWKTAAFVAIEAAAIIVAVKYDKKGNDQTESFQNYADANWSVVKYAQWVIRNKLNGVDPGIIISDNTSLPPWERINWGMLNHVESTEDVGSHTLPVHGKQQYFEEIGKYHQYAPGWNDFPENQTTNVPISPNFNYYSGERGKANDFYSIASTFVKVIVANHFLSAIDAAWSATRYNKKLNISMKMKEMDVAGQMEFNPELRLSYNF